MTVTNSAGTAVWRGLEYTRPLRVLENWDIDEDLHWFLASTFEGACVAVGFAEVGPISPSVARWPGIARDLWATSLDRAAYVGAVHATQSSIAAGTVYQANVCRILSAPWPPMGTIRGLWQVLDGVHGAPYSGYVDIPAGWFDELPDGLGIVSSSPETFLQRRGPALLSAPIKGTAHTEHELQPKDRAENLMIVDLMRNDLAKVSDPGSVAVPKLFAVEPHPGLVHLVSYVESQLRDGLGWDDIAEQLLPPGSVSGAPKSSAVRIVAELEGRARGYYCGTFGVARGAFADLAVGIRSFFRVGERIEFGTGAGITWGSDPEGEWAETELKASRLLAAAEQRWGTA